jgi:ankyrin repeat protein
MQRALSLSFLYAQLTVRRRLLLESGADVNAEDTQGVSCLHSAVASGSLEVVRALLAAGANVQHKDKKTGASPLRIALLVTFVKVCQVLLCFAFPSLPPHFV